MVLPNFLLIGAAKSGTTALYHYLNQHPQIYMSAIKEPHFFAFENQTLNFSGPGATINDSSVVNLQQYESLFDGVSENHIARGEASALYLYIPDAPLRIKQYVPEAKIVAILRHPADRAYASYMQLIRDGREPLESFSKALEAEKLRIKENWGFLWRYQDLGFYGLQLKRYFQLFPKDQIEVYLYDDFKANPLRLMESIFNFIEVDSHFVPDMSIRPNVSGIPKYRKVHKFLTEKNPIKTYIKPLVPKHIREKLTNQFINKNLSKPSLDIEIREELVQSFSEDILYLQDLIDRDLSSWLKVNY